MTCPTCNQETPQTPAQVLTEAMSRSGLFSFIGASTPPRTEYLLRSLAEGGYEIVAAHIDGPECDHEFIDHPYICSKCSRDTYVRPAHIDGDA